MAGSVNKATLLGYLGNDPDIRQTQAGKPIANFRMATSESWKDQQGQRQERTQWHSVVIFNEGLARIVEQYLKKGSRVYLEGSMQTRKWQDQSGNDRYTTEVVLTGFNSCLHMLDNKSGDRPPPASGPQDFGNADSGQAPVDNNFARDLDDEVPF